MKICSLLVTLLLVGLPFGPASGAPRANNLGERLQTLSANVERAEDFRTVKNLQISYAQYAQFGLWREMTKLFSKDAVAVYGGEELHGQVQIQRYYLEKWGHGHEGVRPGEIQTRLIDSPVLNLSADGKVAKGRWHELALLGQLGKEARWSGGVMENEYAKEAGRWKITRLHYYPTFAGSYETGWHNVTRDLPLVPYHFTPQEVGNPIPAATSDRMPTAAKIPERAFLASLDRRIAAMNDEDKVRNLQNAYGYYIDRKMWDDAADLFAPDAVFEDADAGVWMGAQQIRRQFERSGPQGLLRGQANDQPIFDMSVTILPSGQTALARGLTLLELGDMSTGAGTLGVVVFDNRYSKGGDGKWHIQEMRNFPVMLTDYFQGWSRSRLAARNSYTAIEPNKPVPAEDRQEHGVPFFFMLNPATGRAVVLPSPLKPVGGKAFLPYSQARSAKEVPGDMDAALADAERRLAISIAYSGIENISGAYGNYIDDFDWHDEAQLYTSDGWRGKYLVGLYAGPDHVEKCERYELGDTPSPRLSMDIHWRIQPVIDVASDGKSAYIRTRLFHLTTNNNRAGTLSGGMYPNDHAFLIDGAWKFDVASIDEPYLQSSSYEDGWARFKARPQSAPSGAPAALPPLMQKLVDRLPPDVPLSSMPKRYHGFIPGDIISFPDIKPMWFAYANPISGRLPPYYCPDLKTCEKNLQSQ
jgi:hypothetical protein